MNPQAAALCVPEVVQIYGLVCVITVVLALGVGQRTGILAAHLAWSISLFARMVVSWVLVCSAGAGASDQCRNHRGETFGVEVRGNIHDIRHALAWVQSHGLGLGACLAQGPQVCRPHGLDGDTNAGGDGEGWAVLSERTK